MQVKMHAFIKYSVEKSEIYGDHHVPLKNSELKYYELSLSPHLIWIYIVITVMNNIPTS